MTQEKQKSSKVFAGDSAALRCERFETPLTLLLSKPGNTPLVADFFQAWPSLAHGEKTDPLGRSLYKLRQALQVAVSSCQHFMMDFKFMAAFVSTEGLCSDLEISALNDLCLTEKVPMSLQKFEEVLVSNTSHKAIIRPLLVYAGTEITGVCRNRGAVGGLQALTALEAHFVRVSLQPLPAQGGFHAAYAGKFLVDASPNGLLNAYEMDKMQK